MAMTDRHRQRVGGIGLRRLGKLSSRVIIHCTCDLSAAPLPTTACLMARGAYSLIGTPASAPHSAAPEPAEAAPDRDCGA